MPLNMFETETMASLGSTILSGVGLILVADVETSARMVAFRRSASILDPLLLCAGAHKDLHAPRIAAGEYPACAAMTTGFVFRIENEATVSFMQHVGRSGQLTTLKVTPTSGDVSFLPYCMCITLTASLLGSALWTLDVPMILALLLFIFIRTVNSVVLGRRAVIDWKGAKEPGVRSDLLVLMSQDKWIRVQGLTDDVKAITSGAWLIPESISIRVISTMTTLLLYIDAGIISVASLESKLLFLSVVLATTITIELSTASSTSFTMYGRLIEVLGERRKYNRRLDMAVELVAEVGSDDWCEKMGIILGSKASSGRSRGAAHM